MWVRARQRQEIDLDDGHAENNNYLFWTQYLFDSACVHVCVCVCVSMHLHGKVILNYFGPRTENSLDHWI